MSRERPRLRVTLAFLSLRVMILKPWQKRRHQDRGPGIIGSHKFMTLHRWAQRGWSPPTPLHLFPPTWKCQQKLLCAVGDGCSRLRTRLYGALGVLNFSEYYTTAQKGIRRSPWKFYLLTSSGSFLNRRQSCSYEKFCLFCSFRILCSFFVISTSIFLYFLNKWMVKGKEIW